MTCGAAVPAGHPGSEPSQGLQPRRPLDLVPYRGSRSLIEIGALAAGKARTGKALGNPVLRMEGRVTMVDGILATAVLLSLVLNAALGWWWADPAAGYVLVFYAAREVRKILSAPG